MLREWPNEQSERRPLAPRLYAATVLALCLNTSAFADCNVYGMTPATIATVALPLNLTVPRDSAVGAILYDSNWISTPAARPNCGDTGSNTAGYATAMVPVPGLSNVYQTGVQGIGIKASWFATTSGTPDMDAATAVMTSPASVWGTYSAKLYNSMGRFRVQLIKTGQVLAGSFTLPVKLATGNYGTAEINVLNLSNNTASVAAPACTIDESTVAVAMPVASGRYLPSVGSTTGDTAFSSSVNCPSPVSVSMTMTDAANPTNVGSTLSLSNASTAKGVGYQIVYNGVVISYGPDSAIAKNVNQFSVGTLTTSGVLKIPFTARYVRTGAITPGTADANATFTMSYQ
jgi:type 1 fimbria pilin